MKKKKTAIKSPPRPICSEDFWLLHNHTSPPQEVHINVCCLAQIHMHSWPTEPWQLNLWPQSGLFNISCLTDLGMLHTSPISRPPFRTWLASMHVFQASTLKHKDNRGETTAAATKTTNGEQKLLTLAVGPVLMLECVSAGLSSRHITTSCCFHYTVWYVLSGPVLPPFLSPSMRMENNSS